MRKKIQKKLFVYYQVDGELEEIKKDDANHIISSYSSGTATCIEYIGSVRTWVELVAGDGQYNTGFGIAFFTEDGKNRVTGNKYLCIDCSPWQCKNRPAIEIIQSMTKCLTAYFDKSFEYYYEFKLDNIYLGKEYTGHMHYRSPYESCDDCGNCNGARCDYCKTKYVVEDFGNDTDNILYNGFSKDDAERVYNNHIFKYQDIMYDIISTYDIDKEWYAKEIGASNDSKALFKLLNKYEIPYYSSHQ